MKKALILGGTRFFGRTIVTNLLDQGYLVMIATRGRAPDSFGQSVARVTIERNDLESMRKAFGKQDYDLVIDQLCYSPISAEVSVEVFSGRAGRYLMTSTIAVYEKASLTKSMDPPISNVANEAELDLSNYPIDMKAPWHERKYLDANYAEGKRQAEAYFVQREFPSTRVRVAHVLDAKDDFTGRTNYYLSKILQDAEIEVREPLRVTSFISAQDIAAFITFMSSQKYVGPVNAASPENLSELDLIKLMNLGARKNSAVNVKLGIGLEKGPFSFDSDFAMSVGLGNSLGYTFQSANEWIPKLAEGAKQERQGT